jgi:hypothetical protein
MKKTETIFFYILLLGILSFCTKEVAAQPKVRLVRTNKQSLPIKVQLYGGYNGMSTPDDRLQDIFENTYMTNWGGIMTGLKALVTIDTLGLPFWAGFNAYYQRAMKRSLSDAPGVRYPDSPTPVRGIETVFSYGIEGVLAFGPFSRCTIEIGAGGQYLQPSVDNQTVIIGLFKQRWLTTAMAALNVSLLTYEHGSIDANLRFLRTFGDFNNFQFQSLFCFTFNL